MDRRAMDRGEDAEELAWLAAELSDPRDQVDTTKVIVDRARDLVESADHVSLTVKARRSFTTLGATSDLASELDALQYEVQQGPCVEASVETGWFRSGDLGRDERWARWGPQAQHRGVGSVLSIGLLSQQRPFGSLNFYAEPTGAFVDPDEVDLAHLFTVHATRSASPRASSWASTASPSTCRSPR